MFLLDSLMIAGIRWTLETVVSAAEAELNDDTALREQLLDAAQRRDLGEMSEARYLEIEADLLSRIREIRIRREGGQGPLAFGASNTEADRGDTRIAVEAMLAGDFHAPAPAGSSPSTVAPAAAQTLAEPAPESAGDSSVTAGRTRPPARKRRPARTRS